MSTPFKKIRLLASCCGCSIVVHVACMAAISMTGKWELGAAVTPPPPVMVELADPGDGNVAMAKPHRSADGKNIPGEAAPATSPPVPEGAEDCRTALAPEYGTAAAMADTAAAPTADGTAAASSQEPPSEPESSAAPVAEAEGGDLVARAEAGHVPSEAAPQPVREKNSPTMLRTVSSFLAAKYEKLTYSVSMHGIPIANAELESKYEAGVTSITLRVKSNAAISSVFPVDDVVETQHVGGRYIMTKIRQQEGSFKSDETFTINLRKKQVSWFDLVRPRTLTMTVPSDDVLDSLSGIYYLRSRQLRVGVTQTLHIYDSESYGDVPVEILRKEETRLRNFKKVATLVVRPLQKTAGIFRRTGDVLIWLSDDDMKVPVRIETTIALGKVTAELVSAESRPQAPQRCEVPL